MEKHKLRYVTLLSDGDAKTFNVLNTIRPYGEDIEIDKEECVNHVCKHLGTELRNVASDCQKRKITLGGHGMGRLKQITIKRLQVYYTRAIRSNRTVEAMRKAIMASVYHGFSTDSEPCREYCPTGEKSWCFHQQALARGQDPGPHEKLVHTPLDRELLEDHIMPIYERLSQEHLLSRCIYGKTQNFNECFHSVIWSRCSKESFVRHHQVEFAVLRAAQEFNFGATAAQDTAKFFGFTAGDNMKRLGAKRDKKRMSNSMKYVRDKRNKRHEKVRAAKQKHQEVLIRLEGGPAYGAGQF